MLSRLKIQIVVGGVVVVWLLLALLTGEKLSPTPLRLYSAAGAVLTLSLLAYERYVWRWSIVRRYTKIPLLAGTWRGTTESSYVGVDGKTFEPIATALRITQTASSVTVTLFTGESSSVSRASELKRLLDGRWSLSWLYDNTPRTSVRYRSERHCGAAELCTGGSRGEELSGEYFTDRLTRGELHFREWSPRQYSSAKSAFNASEFSMATPFVAEWKKAGKNE
jgi:hypothetical protein